MESHLAKSLQCSAVTLADFHKLCYKQGQSVDEYLVMLRQAMSAVHMDGLGPETRDLLTSIRNQFFEGLSSRVREMLGPSEGSSFPSLLDHVRQVMKRRYSVAGEVPGSDSKPECADGMQDVLRRIKELEQEHTTVHRRPQSFAGKCFNCGIVGHRAFQCRRPRANRSGHDGGLHN